MGERAAIVAGRRPEPLEGTRELAGEGCVIHAGDIREPEVAEALVERCLDEFGRIDCLVNNAGGQFVAPAEDISPNGWRAVRRLNLDAPWYLTQLVAKRWMIGNGGGRVISVVLCPRRGIEGMAHSSAARAGMGALTNTLALEWGRYGIGLVAVMTLSLALEKPLLLEGEAGVGKTEAAKALAAVTGARLIRLQCYEGIDVAHALYDWNHARQLLYIRTIEADEDLQPGRTLPDAFRR